MAVLGIDISKTKFDATLITKEGNRYHRKFNNNVRGFRKLDKWVKKQTDERVHACMEATNVYWEKLALFLYGNEYDVSVVNPARIKGFSISQLNRSKTDKVDSRTIAQFCSVIECRIWVPPTPEQRKLRALVRHNESLKKTVRQYENRQETTEDPYVKASQQKLLDQLNSEIADIEKEIQAFIDAHCELKEKQDLIISIKGVGLKTAIIVLAEMYDIESYENARAVAADVGVTPCHHQSGSSVLHRPRMSKMGKTVVRGALYMPAISALQHNPILIKLKERLTKQGKSKKAIIGAAMRKLMHIIYGVLKNKEPFDPEYTK